MELAGHGPDSEQVENRPPEQAHKQQDYLVFVSGPQAKPFAESEPSFSRYIWRPSLTRILPPQLCRGHALWWFAHYLRVFRNRDYCVYVVMDGDRIVHRSCVVPPYFRWPFMRARDVQISSTWTDPSERGKGLATETLRRIINTMHDEDRHFWYVTRAENVGSIAVCKKAGFSYYGRATRRSRYGIRLLGQLVIEELADDENLVGYGR